jgi:hypothetical protein
MPNNALSNTRITQCRLKINVGNRHLFCMGCAGLRVDTALSFKGPGSDPRSSLCAYSILRLNSSPLPKIKFWKHGKYQPPPPLFRVHIKL